MWAKCRKYAKIVQKNWGNFLQAWTRPDLHWCKFSSHTCAAVDAHFSLQLDPCRVFGVKIQNLNYNCLKTETLIMHHYSFQSYPCMCIVSVARTNIFKLHLALVKVWSVFCHLRFVQKFTATTPISWSDFTWGTEAGNVQTSKTRPHQISRCWQQCVLLCKLPWCLLSDLLCAKVWVVAKMRGWLSSRYSRPQEKIFNSWENSLISFPSHLRCLMSHPTLLS